MMGIILAAIGIATLAVGVGMLFRPVADFVFTKIFPDPYPSWWPNRKEVSEKGERFARIWLPILLIVVGFAFFITGLEEIL